MTIKKNYHRLLQKIKLSCQHTQRQKNSLQLLAVSKKRTYQEIEALYQLGQRNFAESYLQEAIKKQHNLNHLTDIQWHFIGPIQSNKIKTIATRFDWVHSVAKQSTAHELNKHCSQQPQPINICIQVNISAETQKQGVHPSEIESLLTHCQSMSHLRVRGLMAIPAPTDTTAFEKMEKLYQKFQQPFALDTLSLGMSNDFESAIAHGSTIVRIGRALFEEPI